MNQDNIRDKYPEYFLDKINIFDNISYLNKKKNINIFFNEQKIKNFYNLFVNENVYIVNSYKDLFDVLDFLFNHQEMIDYEENNV